MFLKKYEKKEPKIKLSKSKGVVWERRAGVFLKFS